jgi:hypothetical protein
MNVFLYFTFMDAKLWSEIQSELGPFGEGGWKDCCVRSPDMSHCVVQEIGEHASTGAFVCFVPNFLWCASCSDCMTVFVKQRANGTSKRTGGG